MNDDTIKKNISKNIAKYREASGLSQKELAQKLNVVPSRISNWETGANCPTIDILFEVCNILDVSINDIYGVYPDSKFILQYDEQEIIKKYRALDKHGKEMVDFTLEKEWERSILASEEGQLMLSTTPGYYLDIVKNGKVIPYVKADSQDVVLAAHNDHGNVPGEFEKMMEDIEGLKKPE